MSATADVRALEAAVDRLYQLALAGEWTQWDLALRDARLRCDVIRASLDVDALVARGRLHVMLAHLTGEGAADHAVAALALLRAAADLAPADPRVLAHLAEAALVRTYTGGRLVQTLTAQFAARCAERALALEPESAIAHSVLGLLALFAPSHCGGSPEAAERHLARAVAAAPERHDWAVWLECARSRPAAPTEGVDG